MVIASFAYAGQVDDWLHELEHPYYGSNQRKPQNQLQKYISYDLSSLLTPRTEFLGYISSDRLKIEQNHLVVG